MLLGAPMGPGVELIASELCPVEGKSFRPWLSHLGSSSLLASSTLAMFCRSLLSRTLNPCRQCAWRPSLHRPPAFLFYTLPGVPHRNPQVSGDLSFFPLSWAPAFSPPDFPSPLQESGLCLLPPGKRKERKLCLVFERGMGKHTGVGVALAHTASCIRASR